MRSTRTRTCLRESKRPVAQLARDGHVADAEAGTVGVIGDDEGGIFGAEEVRAAGARHLRHREVRRHARRGAAFVGDDGAEAGVKADEGAAADRDARRSAGHHVVVAGAVVALVVADGAHHGQLVGDARRAACRCCEKSMPGTACADGLELAADLLRRFRLGVEGLVVRRPAVQPDEDAALRLGRPRVDSSRRARAAAARGRVRRPAGHPGPGGGNRGASSPGSWYVSVIRRSPRP